MAENTKTQLHDHTFNPWGSEASGATRVVAAEEQWRQVREWDEQARKLAVDPVFFNEPRPRVFVAPLADVFEDWEGPMVDSQGRRLSIHPSCGWAPSSTSVPSGDLVCGKCGGWCNSLTIDDVRSRLFELIDDCTNLDFMLLTKRPENIRRFWPSVSCNALSPLKGRRYNVHLCTSITCQEDADRNIPLLLQCRDLSPVLGVSAEPLVGPVDLVPYLGGRSYCCRKCGKYARTESEMTFLGGDYYRCDCCGLMQVGATLDHVIVGGESGPNARPCNVDWIRAIVQQCKEAGVPCFVKQFGSNVIENCPIKRCHWPPLTAFYSGGGEVRAMLKDLKGGDPSEWPEDLMDRDEGH